MPSAPGRGTPNWASAATAGVAGAAVVLAVASTAVGATAGAAAAAGVAIAAAARAIAHPIRFILTPKNWVVRTARCQSVPVEIGGLIGAGFAALKGVEPSASPA